jgi:hypothetical protein
MKHIAIFGGTGFIGSALAEELERTNHKVTVVTRKRATSNRYYTWDYKDRVRLNDLIAKVDCVINLVGSSIVGQKWTDEYKTEILESRTKTTKIIVDGINNFQNKHLINASAIGYYGYKGDEILTEDSEPGEDFVSDVCVDWERSTNHLNQYNQKAIVRIGVVFDLAGGALPKLVTPHKFFVGAPLGSGNQYISWISLEDLIDMFIFIIDNNIIGIYNGTCDQPIRNKELTKAIAKTMKRPVLPNVPALLLKLILGEQAAVVLESQRVIPQNILENGFEFKDNDILKYLDRVLNN